MKLPSTQIAATFLQSLGISVVRVARDTKKRPDGAWQQYQTRRADYAEVMEMFSDGAPLGIITGTISGNLTMAEIEGRAALEVPNLRNLAHDSGLGELWDKVDQGWKEISPTGGVHWFYRTPDAAPGRNQKLAQRPSTPEELAAWKQREAEKALEKIEDPALQAKRLERIERSTVNDVLQVLTETRGEGGFVVVAPTAGRYHPLQAGGWRMARGCSPQQVPDLTPAEAGQFLDLLRTLDVPIPGRTAPQPDPAPQQQRPTSVFGALSPLDDFEQRTDWAEILIPAGWQLHSNGARPGERYWTRPGKEVRDGHSASTGRDAERDRLWVFTSSTEFIPEVPYTKPGAYALLEHGGNHSAAASELRKQGYGRDPEIRATASPPSSAADTQRTSTRQDSGPSGIDPGRTPTPAGVPAEGNLAPVVDISTKRKPGKAAQSRTALANAERFVSEHSSKLRFDSVKGCWVIWETAENRWVAQPKAGAEVQLAIETVLGLPEATEEDRKWRVKSSTGSMIRDMLFLAQSDPRVRTVTTDYDAEPWELNTPAGPVDLKTGKMLEPTPEKLHTFSTGTVPDFAADRTPWMAFLTQTFSGDAAMVEYFQWLAGYTLIGTELGEHLLIFGHGKGGNGKGVAMEVMSGLLGDYAINVATDFLMKKPFPPHPEEMAALYGARMVVCSEIDPKAKFDEARTKKLSGGDKLSGRFMRENTFYWLPTHQLWLTGNHLPKIESGGGDSFFRRVRMLPFLNSVPKEQVDPGLKDRLLHEHGPAILAWMIEGAVKYAKARTMRHVEPGTVAAATSAYRDQADTVKMFLEEECDITPQELRSISPDRVAIKKFYDRYKAWCEPEDRPLGPRQLTAALAEHGINTTRGAGGIRFYEFVQLIDQSQRFAGMQPYDPGEKKD